MQLKDHGVSLEGSERALGDGFPRRQRRARTTVGDQAKSEQITVHEGRTGGRRKDSIELPTNAAGVTRPSKVNPGLLSIQAPRGWNVCN